MTRIIVSDQADLSEEFRVLRAASNSQEREDLIRRRDAQKQKVRRLKIATANPYSMGGAVDTVGIAPEYHIPQLENSSLELPRNRQEIINWCDYYYQTNELIGTAVDIHATLSISDFSISCDDAAIQAEYEELLDDLNYMELLNEIAHEYFRVGNVFPMGLWSKEDKCWTEFTLIPMLLIDLKKTLFTRDPLIFLLPSDHVKDMSTDENLKEDFKRIPDEHRNALVQGKPVLLDSNHVSHISTRSIAGTLWGVPPVYRCFKTMVYSDKLYRAQEAIADGHITPLRIISLVTPDGLPVTPDEEENFRQQLVEQSFDPNYIILTSGQVKDAYIGSSGRIINTSQEMDMIERKVTSGMKINKALLHGEGPTYANAQVYQTQMNFYYANFRTRLSTWLRNKIFKPVAQARGYYQTEEGEKNSSLSVTRQTKRLILPDIVWKGTGNLDSQTVSLLRDLWNQKKISSETFFSMVVPDIEYQTEQVKVLREAEFAVALEKKNAPIADELNESFDGKEQAEGSPASTKPKDQPLKVVKHNTTLTQLNEKYGRAGDS